MPEMFADDDAPKDEETTPEETPAAEAPPEEAPAAEEAPAPEAEEAPEEEAPAEEAAPAAEEAPAEEAAAEEAPAAEDEAPKPKREKKKKEDKKPDAIPGAHLEPDLVLEEKSEKSGLGAIAAAELEAAEAALAAQGDDGEGGETVADEPEPEAIPTPILELAADARYSATGKRKSAIARVTLKPGKGVYTINGRELNEFFPRPSLQRVARQPLETVGLTDKLDVVAQIRGGGVSAQAGALRHGIARSLVDADENLRGDLKRRGFLTRDPRVKERKKAGLKKARKRPQFSKR
jgi:small subunit ribosomal protein S9